MRVRSRWPTGALVVLLAMTTMACGGGTSAGDAPGSEGSTGHDAQASAVSAKETVASSLRTATAPDDPCGWIPVSDVEAIVGKLAEPPKRADGCRYTIVMPEAVSARRQDAVAQRERLQEQLKARFKDYEPMEFGGPLANYERDPATYAMSLSVDLEGKLAGELGMAAAGKVMASWLPPQDRKEKKAPSGPPDAIAKGSELEGWDTSTGLPYGFSGRIGHIRISVQGQAPDVPTEQMQALAARVRDRIPDLPFPVTNPYQIMQRVGNNDPCSLLTRAEAEAVLGPLVVDPYLSSSEYPPLVHSRGHGCAYFTAGHHVFVLSPTWEDGEQSFGLEKGIGGLIGMVAPQELTVMKGPWDKAHISGTTGALLFLKGERLLEVHYLTSATDRRGAVRLAAQAMARFAPP